RDAAGDPQPGLSSSACQRPPGRRARIPDARCRPHAWARRPGGLRRVRDPRDPPEHHLSGRGRPVSPVRPVIARYPFVVATLLVAAVTGALLLTPAAAAAPWVASAFAVLIAARSSWSMIRSLRQGTWGIDILAVAAIVS